MYCPHYKISMAKQAALKAWLLGGWGALEGQNKDKA